MSRDERREPARPGTDPSPSQLDQQLDQALATLGTTDAVQSAQRPPNERADAIARRLRRRRRARRRRGALALAAVLVVALSVFLLQAASADRQHERELRAAAAQLERLQAEIRLLRHQIDAAQRRADAMRPALYLAGDERAAFYLDLAALARSRAARSAGPPEDFRTTTLQTSPTGDL